MKETKYVEPVIEIYNIEFTDVITTSDPELGAEIPGDWGTGGWT